MSVRHSPKRARTIRNRLGGLRRRLRVQAAPLETPKENDRQWEAFADCLFKGKPIPF